MRHVIDINRAGLESLIKATLGSVGAHKYIRRKRYWYKGKLAWRYFYLDDSQRTRHQKEIDKEHRGAHVEHYLITDLEKVYESFKRTLPATKTWTEERLSQQLKTRPKVKMSPAFKKKHLTPSLDAEKHGLDPERNTTQRIAMALGMLTEKVQGLVDIQSIKILDSSDHAAGSMSAVSMEKVGAGNQLTLTADTGGRGINTAPHGDPHFGSALTLTEERVWHQIGRTILDKAKTDKRLLAKLTEFKTITSTPSVFDQPVSSIAEQNWQSDFAESFACLMSHPKQLAHQAPSRYEWLVANGFGNNKLPKKAAAMEETPRSDWEWFEARKQTRTRAMFDKLKERAPTDIPYRSEKDQFYTMTVDGRTIYFRIGPPDAASEAGWDRMPDNIDKKTGLPLHDSTVSNAFHAPTFYKEVYDDHGNRLDPVSAFFYLQQG